LDDWFLLASLGVGLSSLSNAAIFRRSLFNLYKEMMQLLSLQFVYIGMNRMTSPNEGL
jgi:hypothetical protein